MSSAPVSARLLDLSDLFHGVGKGPATGINRVGIAYLQHLLGRDTPLYGLVHHQWGAFLLDRAAVAAFADALTGANAWPRAGWVGALQRGLNPTQRQAFAQLRQNALAWTPAAVLARMLRRHLPAGTSYIGTGLGNLRRPVFAALRAVPQMRIGVFIHDTIPLDFPQFVPRGGEAWFEDRLRAVGEMADLVLYNSSHSRDSAEARFARWGRVPEALVAHLGVTPMRPDPAMVPAGLDLARPYFVTLGTIEPRKNHALLLDLWEQFARQRPPGKVPALLIIGTRGWRNEAVLRRLDSLPPTGSRVVELSGLGDGAVAALVARARALLFPSHCEGFGLPAIEAAALGTPVICNDLPVYREFLGDYPAYAPVSDPQLWARTILAFADAPPRNGQAAPPALPQWQAHFDKVFSHI